MNPNNSVNERLNLCLDSNPYEIEIHSISKSDTNNLTQNVLAYFPITASEDCPITVLEDFPTNKIELRSKLMPLELIKLFGGITNDIYKITHKIDNKTYSYILRMYGKSDKNTSLFDRKSEIMLAKILSEYELGPKVYTLFNNGRIEEFYEGCVMNEINNVNNNHYKQIMRKIKEFHKASINIHLNNNDNNNNNTKDNEWGIIKSIKRYRNIINLHTDCEINLVSKYPNIDELINKIIIDAKTIVNPPNVTGCHNDIHHGNIIVSHEQKGGEDTNICVKLIDFEYFDFNPQLYDIANYFTELHSHHSMYDLYPSYSMRKMFYEFYMDKELNENELTIIDEQVDVLAKLSHLNWGLWRVVKFISTQSDNNNNNKYFANRLGRFCELMVCK